MKKKARKRPAARRPGGCPERPGALAGETAALYALGALLPAEAAAFEAHLQTGCAACDAEARSQRELIGALGRAVAAEAAPPPALKDQLFARLRARRSAAAQTQVWKSWSAPAPQGAPGLTLVRAGEGAWQPTAVAGVEAKQLFVDRERRLVTMLIRMAPGSAYPRHRHGGAEECYVLEGELRVGDELILRAGDYQRADEDSVHLEQRTEGGCLLLISSSQDDELV